MSRCIKVNRFELIKCLEIVSLAVNSNNISPGPVFRFYNGFISATDGIFEIIVKLKNPIDEFQFEIGINILNFLKNLSTDEVTIRQYDDYIIISSNKSKMKFSIVRIKNISVNDKLDELVTKVSPPASTELINGLIACHKNVAIGDTAGIIGGVRIKNDEIISTNRFRIFRYLMKNKSIEIETVVPIKFINVISKYKDNESITICKHTSSLRAFVETELAFIEIKTKLLIGKFPELSSYFPNVRGIPIKFPKDFKNIITRHLMAIKGIKDIGTNISIKDSLCTIRTVNNLVCEIEDTIDLDETHKDEISFIVSPSLLIDIPEECNELQYYVDKKFITFEHENMTYLIQTME